jgi:excisionase family DNA binding protein
VDRAFLKADEVAEVIGLGRSKTYQLVQQGIIPSVHIGKSRRVPAVALQRWIDERTAEAEARQGTAA